MKKRTRLQVARAFQKEIAKLQREREKLYAKALRKLRVSDDNYAWDYFFNNLTGFGAFVDKLK